MLVSANVCPLTTYNLRLSHNCFISAIVYKALYEEVFEIPNVDQIANAMLFNKVVVISKDKHEERHGEEEVVTKDNLDNAIIAPFPYKVAKALHPDIYRNIEYDSWNNMRKGKFNGKITIIMNEESGSQAHPLGNSDNFLYSVLKHLLAVY